MIADTIEATIIFMICLWGTNMMLKDNAINTVAMKRNTPVDDIVYIKYGVSTKIPVSPIFRFEDNIPIKDALTTREIITMTQLLRFVDRSIKFLVTEMLIADATIGIKKAKPLNESYSQDLGEKIWIATFVISATENFGPAMKIVSITIKTLIRKPIDIAVSRSIIKYIGNVLL